MADAWVFAIENINLSYLSKDMPEIRNAHTNIGTGEEISINDLAELGKNTTGFSGELFFNTSKPDGRLRKLTDLNKLHKFRWKGNIGIQDGVTKNL